MMEGQVEQSHRIVLRDHVNHHQQRGWDFNGFPKTSRRQVLLQNIAAGQTTFLPHLQ